MRGTVGVDEPKGETRQPLGELDRIGDRRRGEDEARLGAVYPGHAAQSAQHVGHVRAEDPAVGVRLVDDDPAESGEEIPPALVVREDAHAQHVGVREDEVRAPADRRAVVSRGVAVVDRRP